MTPELGLGIRKPEAQDLHGYIKNSRPALATRDLVSENKDSMWGVSQITVWGEWLGEESVKNTIRAKKQARKGVSPGELSSEDLRH